MLMISPFWSCHQTQRHPPPSPAVAAAPSSFAKADDGSFFRGPPVTQWQLPPPCPAYRPSSSHRCHPYLSPPPSTSLVVNCNVFVLLLLSTLLAPTRPQSQCSMSQGYMRLLPTTHVPKRSHVDACRRVLAMVFAWWKEFSPKTYWGRITCRGRQKIP